MTKLHGTAVALGANAVLILGASGSGKSSLALHLMALGAKLVADDTVILTQKNGILHVSCPPIGQGIIEARRVGLLTVNFVEQAGLEIVVDLDKTVTERLPKSEYLTILGAKVPLIRGRNTPNLAPVIWCLLGDGKILPTE